MATTKPPITVAALFVDPDLPAESIKRHRAPRVRIIVPMATCDRKQHIGADTVAAWTGYAPGTIRNLKAAHKFPQPIAREPGKKNLWVAGDIMDYIEAREAASAAP